MSLSERKGCSQRDLRVGRTMPFVSLAICIAAVFGALLTLDVLRSSARPPTSLDLELELPITPDHKHEPLITVGKRGAADFLYVAYLDAETIIVGYDSWGAGGPTSPPIKIPSGGTLSFRVTMPPLAALGDPHAAPILKLHVPNQLDWRVPVNSHAGSAGDVQWAVNHAGGTGCGPYLSGKLRRAGAHELHGTGAARYLTWRERVNHAVAGSRARLLLYAAAATVVGWLVVFHVGHRRLRQACAHVRQWIGFVLRTPAPADQESERATWIHTLPAKPFVAGALIGFAGCVAAGVVLGNRPLFVGFRRFIQPIQPQTYFYPTIRELVTQVRSTVPRDKTLVLVGGASYFRGTGQNPGELWTLELQRLLGDRYAVVNFAIDQAGPPAFAGVVFQALAADYPNLVYVTSGSPSSDDALDGGGVYRYLYWDAYYKGMLPTEAERRWQKRVEGLIRSQTRTDEGQELHLGRRLDALTYATDLWTWFGYRVAFPVWSDSYPLHPFRPRKEYVEGDDPNLAESQRRQRADASLVRMMNERALGSSRSGYRQDADGKWVADESTPVLIRGNYDRMFPPSLRRRTLIVLLHGNPYFMQELAPEDRHRFREKADVAERVIGELGYQVVQAGQDFSPDDFVDAGHFMASGGRKVARIVAEKIRQFAAVPE